MCNIRARVFFTGLRKLQIASCARVCARETAQYGAVLGHFPPHALRSVQPPARPGRPSMRLSTVLPALCAAARGAHGRRGAGTSPRRCAWSCRAVQPSPSVTCGQRTPGAAPPPWLASKRMLAPWDALRFLTLGDAGHTLARGALLTWLGSALRHRLDAHCFDRGMEAPTQRQCAFFSWQNERRVGAATCTIRVGTLAAARAKDGAIRRGVRIPAQ